jgi:serine/threonine protein kinase
MSEQPTWFIKCHKDEVHFETEISTLTSLAGVTGVVQLQGVDLEKHAFAASPVCENLSLFRGRCVIFKLASQLLSTLRAVHSRGFLHRDARASNFLVVVKADGSPEQAMVCDWATAIRLGEEKGYAGALHFAADSVLLNIQEEEWYFAFTAAMDLESLVKSVWDLSLSSCCGVSLLPRDNPVAILNWWQTRASSDKKLATYLRLARNLDYDGLERMWL